MRRLRVCLIIAPALFALGGGGCTQPPGPSVLLITLDTTRADRLGVYGGAVPTPAYDRLAASGAVFERAYASTPLTIPSHATILTGLSPLSHGVRENGDATLSPEIPTLATRLSEAGWTGAAFTSAFPTRARWGLARGFSIVHDDVSGDSTHDDFGDCRKAALVVDDAITTLSGVEGPVFAWVHLFDAHWPYEAPAPWSTAFEDPYNAELAYVEAQVDRLLRFWDERYPGGIVVLTADHGEALGEGGERTHGILLGDGTIRVPLIVRGPGIAAESRVSEVVGLTDIAPTILAMLGQDPPPTDGVDLRAGGSGEVYSESLTGRSLLGISPLQALTSLAGRVTRGTWADFTPFDGRRVAIVGERGAPAAAAERRLDAWLAAHPERAAESVIPDDETRLQLEALGYFATDGAGEPIAVDPRQVIELVPLIWQVQPLIQARRLADAERVLARLEGALPGSPAALEPRIELLAAQGRVEEAISVAVDLYLRFPSARRALTIAQLTESTGDRVGALDWADEALAREPHQPAAQAVRVRLLLGLGEITQASVLAEQCLAADPDNLDVALALAELALIQGRPEEAEALALRVIGRLTDSSWARVVLAEAAWASGRPEEAIAGLQDALRSNPFHLPVRMRLGEMLLEVGRNAEAVRTLEPATALRPDDVLVQRAYADALLALDAELSRSALQRQTLGLPETTP